MVEGAPPAEMYPWTCTPLSTGPAPGPLTMPSGHAATSQDGSVSFGTCAVNCNNDLGVYSFHPGGANVLLCDGSVRSVRESIDLFVFYALVTRSEGEVVGSF